MRGEDSSDGRDLGATLALLFVALLIVGPAIVVLFTGGVLTSAVGSEQFYQAAIGVLGALLISFVFQFKALVEDLHALFGRAESLLILLVLVSWLGGLIAGVGYSLAALQDCKAQACGGGDEFNNVVMALGIAAIYVIVAFVSSAIAAHRSQG